ncbi:MAG: beta-N-acetylhexosaminidase [Pedobacter sp.]|nr:beta-N-acetylhexosaminidase [Pedobacter sp.]
MFQLNAVAQTKDFAVKGFHLDLRIQVMKPSALKAFALKLSKSGINTLIMEYEATFPFEKHPLISNRYAYTKEELKDFISYCSSIKLDVIPLQQCFGHVEYILRNERYAKLREDSKDFSQVNPLEINGTRALFTDLFQEVASLHPSKYFHIGCDETRLLGKGPQSKAKIEKEGIGKLYGDYVAMMCDIVIKMGKIPVLWADIALKHPESLKYLPKQTIFVDWNYGWSLDRFGDHAQLMKSGFEIWGAPSLRSSPDNYNLTTWEKHFNNVRDFIPQARQLGYTGVVMTSWSTSGIYSYLYESGSDLVELYALRRVYPLSGFNILLDAFLQSINTSQPLQIQEFVRQYAADRYGLQPDEAQQLWPVLKAIPYQVSNGKVRETKMSIGQLVDSAAWVSTTFAAMKPVRNQKEFEHYRIMADTRLQYLRYQQIENEVNQPRFTAEQKLAMLPRLKTLINETAKVNKRYTKLNKNEFYERELNEDNELRIIKMKLLYDRLAGSR